MQPFSNLSEHLTVSSWWYLKRFISYCVDKHTYKWSVLNTVAPLLWYRCVGDKRTHIWQTHAMMQSVLMSDWQPFAEFRSMLLCHRLTCDDNMHSSVLRSISVRTSWENVVQVLSVQRWKGSVQGVPQSWKIIEFCKTIFQAWKVIKDKIGHGK